jgi:hypothetical protein
MGQKKRRMIIRGGGLIAAADYEDIVSYTHPDAAFFLVPQSLPGRDSFPTRRDQNSCSAAAGLFGMF